MGAFAPLMGCWRGAFEGQPDIHDERCFEPLGMHVVDRHFVRPTSYAGETTYHLDDGTGAIVFAYASNDGGRSNGALELRDGALDFPAHEHVSADGRRQRLRSTWTMEGADRFVVVSEREEGGAWQPWGRITYERAPAAP